MPETHSKVSPSGAKKWLNCTMSVTLESQFPDKRNEAAEEGTTAHCLAENKILLMLGNITEKQYTENLRELKDVNEEMEEYINSYVSYVFERFNNFKRKCKDSFLMTEQKLNLNSYIPEGQGTSDVVIIGEGFAEIIDLKYGKHVNVSAYDNPQLKIYALGVIEEYDFLFDIKSITLNIYQPRMDNISSYEIDTKELLNWGESIVKPKAIEAFKGVGKCSPGIHCTEGFCKARPQCKAYKEKQMKISKYKFSNADLLSAEDTADILKKAGEFISWINSVKDYALENALVNGVNYPGFKLVEGRSNRIYYSENDISSILINNGYDEDKIYIKKLKGITEMQKLMGKTKFEKLLGSYIIKPPGKPVLVEETDKRTEFCGMSSAKEDFKIYINN